MNALPGWDDLSDLDKGAVLLHNHKREWEGEVYAEENYPASYFDHPALVALSPIGASRHAASSAPPRACTTRSARPSSAGCTTPRWTLTGSARPPRCGPRAGETPGDRHDANRAARTALCH